MQGSFYPTEYPLNKDGYRYILAEPDRNAPFGTKYHHQDSTWLAGKPIPPFLYRMYVPTNLTLSLNDRAHQLRVGDKRLSVTGEKGYCLIRGTHGINYGTWYFECKIDDMPPNSAARIGWAQQYANLQAPLGYDKFGYSIRSRKGTLFHESRGYHFNRQAKFGTGDVIGCYIHLPMLGNDRLNMSNGPKAKTLNNNFKLLEPSCKNSPLIKFKGYFYFEEKDDLEQQIRSLRRLPGSYIAFYKNGVLLEKRTLAQDYPNHHMTNHHANSEAKITTAGNSQNTNPFYAFENVYFGTYFPAISLYYGATVTINPGPNFWYPPTVQIENCSESKYKTKIENLHSPLPVSDLIYYTAAQQTVNDLIYFICNQDKLIIG